MNGGGDGGCLATQSHSHNGIIRLYGTLNARRTVASVYSVLSVVATVSSQCQCLSFVWFVIRKCRYWGSAAIIDQTNTLPMPSTSNSFSFYILLFYGSVANALSTSTHLYSPDGACIFKHLSVRSPSNKFTDEKKANTFIVSRTHSNAIESYRQHFYLSVSSIFIYSSFSFSFPSSVSWFSSSLSLSLFVYLRSIFTTHAFSSSDDDVLAMPSRQNSIATPFLIKKKIFFFCSSSSAHPTNIQQQ